MSIQQWHEAMDYLQTKEKNANPNQLNSMKYALNALKFHEAFK